MPIPIVNPVDLLRPMKGHRLYEAAVRSVVYTNNNYGVMAAENHAKRIVALHEDLILTNRLKGEWRDDV